jgi:hypothetical protein
MTGSPGFSRWDTCRGSGILEATPDPAEAATPERREPDEKFNVRESRLMNFETMLRVWRVAVKRCIECTLRLTNFEKIARI